MKAYRIPLLIMVLALLSAACRAAQSPTAEYHTAHPATADTAQSAQAGQGGNRIEIEGLGLTVDEGGKMTISRVIATAPGWLALHADEAGTPGPVIGYAPVKSGENTDVAVTVDPASLAWKLYPMLYVDEGIVGTFEVPGADTPALVNAQGQPLFLPERIYGDLSWVHVEDQTLGEGNTVVIRRMFSPGPGILVVHAPDRPGRPGIGWAALHAGENLDVTVSVSLEGDSETLGAMLHADNGTIGKYDGFQTDGPASTTAGELLVVAFKAATK